MHGAWIKEFSGVPGADRSGLWAAGEKKSDKDALASIDAGDYVLRQFKDDLDRVKQKGFGPETGQKALPIDNTYRRDAFHGRQLRHDAFEGSGIHRAGFSARSLSHRRTL